MTPKMHHLLMALFWISLGTTALVIVGRFVIGQPVIHLILSAVIVVVVYVAAYRKHPVKWLG